MTLFQDVQNGEIPVPVQLRWLRDMLRQSVEGQEASTRSVTWKFLPLVEHRPCACCRRLGLDDRSLVLGRPAHGGGTVEEKRMARLMVPGCSSDLLVVLVETRGHVVVNDTPHVGLVDAKAEGICRENEVNVTIMERFQSLAAAVRRGRTHVVHKPPNAFLSQHLSQFTDVVATGTVDDAGPWKLMEQADQR